MLYIFRWPALHHPPPTTESNLFWEWTKGITHSPWLRRGIRNQSSRIEGRFPNPCQFQVLSTGQVSLLSTQLTLSHRLLAPKREGFETCSSWRFKSTVGIKHIGARVWHDQPTDWIGPIRQLVRPSKGQNSVLQDIDHCVTGSMTAQPPRPRPSILRGRHPPPTGGLIVVGSYPSAEVQSAYSTAPADRAQGVGVLSKGKVKTCSRGNMILISFLAIGSVYAFFVNASLCRSSNNLGKLVSFNLCIFQRIYIYIYMGGCEVPAVRTTVRYPSKKPVDRIKNVLKS